MKFLDRADAIARWLERFIAGSGANDPLYVSNRSGGQKFKLVFVVGIPVLVLAGLMVLALGNFFDNESRGKTSTAVAVPGEITKNVLPDLAKSYHSESDPDCEVVEAGISGQTLSGRVRNDTDHLIHAADLVFDITDKNGSQMGAISVRVEGIQPHSIVNFHQLLPQQDALSALVREIHTR